MLLGYEFLRNTSASRNSTSRNYISYSLRDLLATDADPPSLLGENPPKFGSIISHAATQLATKIHLIGDTQTDEK